MKNRKGKIYLYLVVALVVVLALGFAVHTVVKQHSQKVAAQALEEAQELIANGDYTTARAKLLSVLQSSPRGPLAEDAYFFMLTLTARGEDVEKTAEYLTQLRTHFPKSTRLPEAELLHAQTLIRVGQQGEAVALLAEWEEKYPEHELLPRVEIAKGEIASANQQWKKASTLLTAALQSSLQSEVRSHAEELLGKVNLRLLLSPELEEKDTFYTLKPGDTIYELARRFGTTQELLMRCNQIEDPRKVRAGRELKVPHTQFSIAIDKGQNTLTVLRDGQFFKRYRVRTGRYPHQTPVGEYEIIDKQVNPEWVNPRTHKYYAPGDPENELGTRWMAFKDRKLGIHGVSDPDTIGTYSSYGCVGLLKEDVEELYDLVPLGTPVTISGGIPENLPQEE